MGGYKVYKIGRSDQHIRSHQHGDSWVEQVIDFVVASMYRVTSGFLSRDRLVYLVGRIYVLIRSVSAHHIIEYLWSTILSGQAPLFTNYP